MEILLILLLIFILYPIFKVGFAVWSLRKKARKMYDEAMKQQQETEGQNTSRREKIFGSDVGEYVEFEEVEETEVTQQSTDETPDNLRRRSVKVEDRIVDVEWEDV